MIYLDQNLIFIHIPKTGGTSIRELFNNYKEYGEEIHDIKKIVQLESHGSYVHMKLDYTLELLSELDNNWEERNINMFSIVRDPYKRVVSNFNFSQGKVARYNIKTGDTDILFTSKNIEDWLIYINRVGSMTLDPHYKPQSYYHDDRLKVFKLENLNELESWLSDILGEKIEMINSNRSMKFFRDENLNKNSIELIKKIYKEDFEKYNYEMG